MSMCKFSDQAQGRTAGSQPELRCLDASMTLCRIHQSLECSECLCSFRSINRDAPPMRFMAMAMVSCVSRLMAPSDMPPVQKRVMMASAGSTSSTLMGCCVADQLQAVAQHVRRAVPEVLRVCLEGILQQDG